MKPILSQSLQQLIVIWIVQAVLAYLIRKTAGEQDEETDSTQVFTCRTPKAYRFIIIIGGLILSALFAVIGIVMLQNGSSVMLIIAICLAVLFAWLSLMASYSMLSVDGNEVSFRNAFLIPSHFQFSDITKVERTMYFVRIYSGKKKLASFSSDNLCIGNLAGRCKEENIPFEACDREAEAYEILKSGTSDLEKRITLVYAVIMNVFPVILLILLLMGKLSRRSSFLLVEAMVYPLILYASFFVFKNTAKLAASSMWIVDGISGEKERSLRDSYQLRLMPLIGMGAQLLVTASTALSYSVVDLGKYFIMVCILTVLLMIPLVFAFKAYARTSFFVLAAGVIFFTLAYTNVIINLLFLSPSHPYAESVEAEVISKRERFDEDDEDYEYYITVQIPDSTAETELAVRKREYEETEAGDTRTEWVYTSVFGIHILDE